MSAIPTLPAVTLRPLVITAEKQPPVQIPPWVVDLASFRRWARSPEFPEFGNITYLGGTIWVDLSMERFWHNFVKTELTGGYWSLLRARDLGLLFSDKMRLTNLVAELSSEPDLLFCTHETLTEGRVIVTEGDDQIEVEGTPDLVVEIVSPSSVEKDTKLLRKLYWAAGIQEYWLIELTKTGVKFELLQRGGKGYTAARHKDGWVKSGVFGRSFKLTRDIDQHRLSRFTLEVR